MDSPETEEETREAGVKVDDDEEALLFAAAFAAAAAAACDSTMPLSAPRTAEDRGLWPGSGAQQRQMRSSSSGGHQEGSGGLLFRVAESYFFFKASFLSFLFRPKGSSHRPPPPFLSLSSFFFSLSLSSSPLVRVDNGVHHGPQRQRPERLPAAQNLRRQDRQAEDVRGPPHSPLRDDLGGLVRERAVRVRRDVGEGRVGRGRGGDGRGDGEGEGEAAAAARRGAAAAAAAASGYGSGGGRQHAGEAKVADLADVAPRVRRHGRQQDVARF